MRAEENGIDMTTDPFQFPVHFLMNGIKGIDIKQPPGDTRLVAGNYDMVAGVVECSDCFQAPCYWLPLIRMFDVLIRINIDHSISIKNYEFHYFGMKDL